MNTKDPRDALNKAMEFILKKKYKQAFELIEWYFDNAETIDPSLSAVRRSSCLSDWAEVAHQYPPAMESLLEKRNKALELAIQEKSVSRFWDFQSICAALGQTKTIIKEYKSLKASDPGFARDVYFIVEPDLVKGKEWALCSEATPSPSKRLNEIRETFQGISDWCEADSINLKEEFTRLLRILEKSGRKKEFAETFDEIKKILVKGQMETAIGELEKLFHSKD